MQKLSVKISKGLPKMTASFASLTVSTPDYMFIIFSVQENTILLNLPQTIKRNF